MNSNQFFTTAVVNACQQRKDAELLQIIAEAYKELPEKVFIEWFDDDVPSAIKDEDDYDWLEIVVYGTEVAEERSVLWAGFRNAIEDAWRVIEMERLRLFSRDQLIDRIKAGEFDRSRISSPGQLNTL